MHARTHPPLCVSVFLSHNGIWIVLSVPALMQCDWLRLYVLYIYWLRLYVDIYVCVLPLLPFLDTVNVVSVKLYLMEVLVGVYPFMLLVMTLTSFHGHSSINHLKAKAVFTNLVQTSFFLFFSVLFYIYILGWQFVPMMNVFLFFLFVCAQSIWNKLNVKNTFLT